MEAGSRKDIIADRIKAGEILVGKKARNSIGIQFGLDDVGHDDVVVRFKNNNFFFGIGHDGAILLNLRFCHEDTKTRRL